MKFDAQFKITHADGDTINTELLGVTFDDIRMEFGALSESFGAINVAVEVTSYLRQRPLVIQSPATIQARYEAYSEAIRQLSTDTECERCASYGEAHTAACPLHPDHDPTPYCGYCGENQHQHCHCGPIAENN